jgi:hypothetical protein
MSGPVEVSASERARAHTRALPERGDERGLREIERWERQFDNQDAWDREAAREARRERMRRNRSDGRRE